jgi:hypothetical protein
MLQIYIQYSFDHVKKIWSQNAVANFPICRAYTTEVSFLVVINTELKPSSRQEIALPE